MKLFGTDGIRGRANEFPITPEVALRAGKAVAQVLRSSGHNRNRVVIGRGTRNAVTIGDGTRNRVTVRGTKAQVTLGAGKQNRGVAARPGARGTCVLPAPPATWSGTPTGYYRDRLARCRVVTR